MNTDNSCKLKGRAMQLGLSTASFADKIGISTASLYRRLSGEVPFDQTEMSKIKEVLHLSDREMMSIFFT